MVVAPVGSGHEEFTAEAKGKRSPEKGVDNDAAEISGASAHAAAVDASFAVVVARDFSGFASSDEAAVLSECRCQTPPVSIVTVDSLIALAQSMSKHHYPLEVVTEALKPIESPSEKSARIAAIRNPLVGVDLQALLYAVWDVQQGEQSEMAVPLNQVKSKRPEWKSMPKEKWDRVFYGLETITGGLVEFVENEYGVQLLNSPGHIIESFLLGEKPGDEVGGSVDSADGD